MIVLLGWGALLLAGAALQVCLGAEPIEIALQGGVGAAAVAMGGALALGRAHQRDAGPLERRDREADRSLATGLAATGVALMAFGAEAGPWLVLIGAGTTALGLLGLVLERRGESGR